VGALLLYCYPLRGMQNPAFVDLIGVVCASAGYFLLLWATGTRESQVPFSDAYAHVHLTTVWQRMQLSAARAVAGVVVVLLGKILSRYLTVRLVGALLRLPLLRSLLSQQARTSLTLFCGKCAAYFALGLLTHLCNVCLFDLIHI
jgi:hypothetical protein